MAISDLRHKVALCSQKDVVDENGSMAIKKHVVCSMWAKIDQKKTSTFSVNGAAMRETRNKQTHIVYVRYSHEYDISAMAWVYEARMKSAPRWFKVLEVGQTEGAGSKFFKLSCRLVERGDNVSVPVEETEPYSLAASMPSGVAL